MKTKKIKGGDWKKEIPIIKKTLNEEFGSKEKRGDAFEKKVTIKKSTLTSIMEDWAKSDKKNPMTDPRNFKELAEKMGKMVKDVTVTVTDNEVQFECKNQKVKHSFKFAK